MSLYEWAYVVERSMVSMIEDGEIESFQRITRKGSAEDPECGQNVLSAIVEESRKIGNLVHLEFREVGS